MSRKRSRRPTLKVWKRAALALGAVALFLGTGPAEQWLSDALRGPRFRLSTIEFLGTQALSAPELMEGFDLRPVPALIDVDVERVTERVASHPRVARCVGARIPPSSLVLEIEERVPVAHLAGTEEGIDLEGHRFALLPSELEALTELQGELRWAQPLLQAAHDLGVKLARVEVRAQEDLSFWPRDRELRIRVGSDPAQSLRNWLRLRDSGVLATYAAREIDLRFLGSAVLTEFEKSKGGNEDGSS